MDEATYNKIRAVVGAAIGVVMAESLMNNSWAHAFAGVILGMAVIYVAKTKVTEVIYDERTAIVQQKAANATIVLVTFGTSIIGIAIVIASSLGYDAPTPYGYFLAYQSIFIMAINNLFVWYYQRQLGG